MIGVLTALVFAVVVIGRISGILGGVEPGVSQAANEPMIDLGPSVARILAAIDRPRPEAVSGGKMVERTEAGSVYYTLDPVLQDEAEKIFSRFKVPYGAFVAIEPSTGRVLAMAEHSEADADCEGLCQQATFPAASLIKVITATAAIETGEVGPDTRIRFEGSPYKLSARKVSPKNKRRENNISTLTDALGISNNVVFAKMGADVVGADKLLKRLEDFGFNRDIPFDLGLENSTAAVPQERYPLARTAAGFGDVYISPLHAALIAAAIANDGMMMRPYVVDTVTDDNGSLLFSNAPAPFGRVADTEIARTVAEMMVSTVKKGTSRKTFNKYARPLVRKLGVAGKTGSLTGTDPPGRYEWFIGFAPADDPKIAVAALVVNQGDLWHIKGTYPAAKLLREHFGL